MVSNAPPPAIGTARSSGLPRPPPPRKDAPLRLLAPNKSSLPSPQSQTKTAPPPQPRLTSTTARRLPVPDRSSSKSLPTPPSRLPAAGQVAPSRNASTPIDAARDSHASAITPTPSLVSGSSVSTDDSPRAYMLKRKPSVICQYKVERTKQSGVDRVAREALSVLDEFPVAVGQSFADPHRPAQRQPAALPALQTNHSVPHSPSQADSARPTQRPTPVSEVSATPSLPHTESPGAFSQVTTATSLTSYSPAVSASPRIGPSFGFSPERLRLGRSDKASKQSPSKPAHAHPFFAQTDSLSGSGPQTRDGHATDEGTSKKPQLDKPLPVHPPELAHLNIAPESSLDRPSGDANTERTVSSRLPKLDTALTASSTANEEGPTTSLRPAGLLSPFDETNAEKPSTVGTRSTATGSPALDVSVKAKSRFGFFSRKAKPDNANSAAVPKPPRKGPSAGTGHEGYGKAGSKSRSGSASSQASSGGLRFGLSRRKNSSASSKDSDLDDFLQQRLSPVYLRGDRGNPDSQRRESGSAVDDSPFLSDVSSPDTPETSGSVHDARKLSIDAKLQQSSEERNAHGEGRDEMTTSKSVLGGLSRLVKARPTESSKLKQLTASSETSLATSLAGDERRPSTSAGVVGGAKSETNLAPKVQKGRSLSNTSNSKPAWKWNPFARTKPQPRTAAAQPAQLSQNIPAHYLSSDEEDHFDAEDLDQIMKEAAKDAVREAVPELNSRLSIMTDFEDDGASLELAPRIDTASAAVADPARTQSIDSIVSDETKHQERIEAEINELVSPAATDESDRPSRLSSVGRIPKVVSKRDRVRKLPNLSFSRPFLEAQPRPSMQHSSPPLSSKSSNFPPSVRSLSPVKGPASHDSSLSLSVPSNARLSRSVSNEVSATRQFFDFGGRKNSDLSYSSSAGTMRFPTASMVAHGPARTSQVSTDESWPEFDDLLDRVITPTEASGSPRRMSKALSDLNEDALGPASGNARPVVAKLQSADQIPRLANAAGFSPHKELPITAANAENVAPWLGDTQPPRSSSVYSSEKDSQSLKHKRSASLPDLSRQAEASTAKPTDERNAVPAVRPASNTKPGLGNENMALFRYRVLMASKWLSFGRLLFSPVHKELGNNPDDRVLIIDGLGNRDWSYYCAVTYPNTQIYSLSPLTAHGSNSGRSSIGGFGQLPNHRNFTYTDFGTDFPFPKSFFTAVSLRFPVATSEVVQKLTISECKRVLRPGGYLEISTLDLDLTNMGNLARRAVRNLKLRMQEADPDVLLKPASDNIQNVLHRRGFENMSRCFVGVPAAGAISNTTESADVDFAALAVDQSPKADESITKIVAQVGHWWYNRCYESITLPEGDLTTSIWNDQALLDECEVCSTTFRLLICYAQKPTCAKRRTVSL